MPCHGNADTHCCWLGGVECDYVEERSMPDRRWACGLMRELKDWDKVLASKEYREHVAPKLEPIGINCKDWPDKPKIYRCRACGHGM